MSLDVYLEGPEVEVECVCSDCGHSHMKPHKEVLFFANITHNLNKMAVEAGIYEALWNPDEIRINNAHQLIPLLEHGLMELENDPDRFSTLNPPNGWGSYEGLIKFVKKYLSACRENPDATVRVWR